MVTNHLYKKDLAVNNLRRLISHDIQPNHLNFRYELKITQREKMFKFWNLHPFWIYLIILEMCSVYVVFVCYLMLLVILNKPERQHPTKHHLYGHLPPITKTIKVRRTRHAGHCWRSRVELISVVLLWTPSHGWSKAERPTWTYIQQLYEDMGCSPEDLP